MSAARDVPPAERTVPALLERAAVLHGDRPLLAFGFRRWSCTESRDAVARLAGALAVAGVSPGDRVALLSSNRPELLLTWLACGWLGAIGVPLNTALRGAQLEHALASARPRLLVVEDELVSVLDGIEPVTTELTQLWVVGGGPHARGWRGLTAEPFPAESRSEAGPHAVNPGDTLSILFTSGTTGVSKGVCCPHAQLYWWGVLTAEQLGVTADDVLYTVLPLFHTNALNTVFQALLTGAELRLGTRFSASRFWAEAAGAKATVTYLLGAMVQILRRTPPSPADTAHRVRVALAPATPAEAIEDFRARFGVELVDGYGSTETNFVSGARPR